MRYLLLLIALTAAGCPKANEPTSREIPSNSAEVCTTHCRSLGLEMSAVVIILSSVGCVCEPAGGFGTEAPGVSAAPGASAAAGGAVVMAHIIAEQERQRHEQQRTQQQQQQQSR